MTNRPERFVVLLAATIAALAGPLALGLRAGQAQDGRATSLASVITDIEAGRRTTPIIGEQALTGEYRVTFLAKEPGGEVPRVVSDVTGWGENVRDDTFDFTIGRMARVGCTNWYSLSTLVAPGARIEYLIVHGRDYRMDPWNPRQTRDWQLSEFVTPGYVPAPDPSQLSPPARGRTSEGRVASRALGGSRRIIVYTPPGYHPDGAYPMAVFEEGVRAVGGHDARRRDERKAAAPPIEAAVSPRLLDHLIGTAAIEPLVVAFVESAAWGDTKSYPRESMRTFLNREVPAWMAAHYAVSANAENRAVLGVSAWARRAVEAALASPAFGRVGLLLPGRRVALEPNLEEAMAKSSRRLHVAILAGLYDRANLATAVSLRRAFTDAGHKVDYIEVAEAHNPTAWRDHVAKVLVALFKPAV